MPADSVDILLLGSGWSASFILPLLREERLSYAYTSRSPPTPEEAADGKIQFQLTDDVDDAEIQKLPRAKTVVVIFPIKDPDLVSRLVQKYESLRVRTRWIQLGSTGIWGPGTHTSNSPYDSSNPRAISEQRLLDLKRSEPSQARASVLNLAGLYGGARQPRNFAHRVGSTKEKLSEKGSVHFLHGRDVARSILLLHQSQSSGWNKRWIVTDCNVYDWWLLFSELKPSIPGESDPEIGAKWVRELMQENDVKHLPRPIASTDGEGLPRFLERALDGSEFWHTMDSAPERKSVVKTGEDQLSLM